MIKRFSRPARGIGGIAEKGGAQRNLEVLEASGQGTFTRHHGRPLQLRGALGTAQERIRPIPDRKCGLCGSLFFGLLTECFDLDEHVLCLVGWQSFEDSVEP